MVERLESNFACRCSPESAAECDEVMEWARSQFTRDDAKEHLITGIVYALNWCYQAQITAIGNDQWSAISAKTYDDTFRVYVQCDLVEDGFAYVYRKFYDEFGEKRKQDAKDPNNL